MRSEEGRKVTRGGPSKGSRFYSKCNVKLLKGF